MYPTEKTTIQKPMNVTPISMTPDSWSATRPKSAASFVVAVATENHDSGSPRWSAGKKTWASPMWLTTVRAAAHDSPAHRRAGTCAHLRSSFHRPARHAQQGAEKREAGD